MPNSTTFKNFQKFLIVSLVITLLTAMFTVLAKTPPAFAACDPSQNSFGCGDESPGAGNGDGGGNGTKPGVPAPSPGPGTGAPAPAPDPYLMTIRNAGQQGTCMDRDDGKASIGWDDYYSAMFVLNWDKDVSPGYGFEYQGYYPGYGHQWKAMRLVGMKCLYPPRTTLVTHKCIISTTATVDMLVPVRKNIVAKSQGSGYAAGSGDFNACINAKSRADANTSITEDGYYFATVVSQVQNVVFEISITPNEFDGSIPGPKMVSASPVYNTAPAGVYGSLHCSTGWVSPATPLANYGDTSACEKSPGNPNGFYQCSSNDVPRVVGYDARNPIQIWGDGKRNKVTFDQRISGDGLTVNNYNTQFRLSEDSAPFHLPTASGFIDPNMLLTEVFRGENDNANQNQMRTNRSTVPFGGVVNEIYVASYEESEMHIIQPGLQALWFSQELRWSGTRTQVSVEVIGIEPGVFITRPIVVQVPTSGICTDTAVIDVQRVHPDKIG